LSLLPTALPSSVPPSCLRDIKFRQFFSTLLSLFCRLLPFFHFLPPLCVTLKWTLAHPSLIFYLLIGSPSRHLLFPLIPIGNVCPFWFAFYKVCLEIEAPSLVKPDVYRTGLPFLLDVQSTPRILPPPRSRTSFVFFFCFPILFGLHGAVCLLWILLFFSQEPVRLFRPVPNLFRLFFEVASSIPCSS